MNLIEALEKYVEKESGQEPNFVEFHTYLDKRGGVRVNIEGYMEDTMYAEEDVDLFYALNSLFEIALENPEK